ncbi:DWNN domain-containing protein [Lipomyces japonicus]|uniref:DWNN domain-containing protein n=1 Tax=Lipomyces japonicus TaxID=56871 RepID=UPI0034CDAC5C
MSFLYYKFRSQKQPQRLTFDGTGISVFEIKREIILINKLGDGTDFDLCIYNADTDDEYEDDAEILPRSSSVIVRRRPAARPGKGTGMRYVGAKGLSLGGGFTGAAGMHGSRKPAAGKQDQALAPKLSTGLLNESRSGNSEDDMINAMLQAETDNWMQTQDRMAGATPVFGGRGSAGRGRPPAPSHPPPAGYVCYRCGLRGHWIQNCPTNNDPNWEHRRVKRTTGIPKAFLKTVSQEEFSAAGNNEKFMVNEDGEYVVVQPDSRSWQSYLQKQQKGAADEDGGDDYGDDGDGGYNDDRRRKRSRQDNDV